MRHGALRKFRALRRIYKCWHEALRVSGPTSHAIESDDKVCPRPDEGLISYSVSTLVFLCAVRVTRAMLRPAVPLSAAAGGRGRARAVCAVRVPGPGGALRDGAHRAQGGPLPGAPARGARAGK